MTRQALLAVGVAALLVASGCSGIDGLADRTESPPDADVAQRYASLHSLEATRVTTVDTGNATNETRSLVRIDLSGDRVRRYQRVLDPASRADDVTVVNDSGAVTYDADENTVTRVPRTRYGYRGNRSAYLQRVVAAAHTDDVADPSSGVSPLPVVPAADGGPSIPEGAIEGFEVDYLGTRTVAGRTAHGFELTAVSAAALSVDRTLWLDSRYFYPLYTTQRLDYRNRTIETTTRLANVTFDADLPSGAFDFDAPANATVASPDATTRFFDAASALRERAAFPVPDPEVPAGYDFEGAQYVDGNVTQATLRYATADGHRLAVTKTTAGDRGSFTLGENVTVAGRRGRYLTTPRAKLVAWSCEERRYAVVATDLGERALVAVADSVGCA